MEVRAAPPEHFDWLLSRIGLVPALDFRAIEAVDGSGEIRAMVGYDRWTHNSVNAHIAVDAPIALRSIVPAAFAYPFQQVGYGVIVAPVAADNLASMRLCQGLGFRDAYRIRDGHKRGVDLVLWEMRREACRHLKEFSNG